MSEEWRDIRGYDGAYQVSSLGNVRSWKPRNGKGGLAEKSRVLSQPVWGPGYRIVNLWKDGKQKLFYVHRLVAMAFLGESSKQVNHRNGNKEDNSVGNLEYVTSLENTRHAIEILGVSSAGEAHPQAKLTNKDVLEIIRLYDTGHFTHKMIADRFNVAATNVTLIVNGKRWSSITGRNRNGQRGPEPARV